MKAIGLVAALMIAGAASFKTQVFAAAPALPDVPSFCSSTTAFGQTMGSTVVAGVKQQLGGISAFASISAQYAPFQDAEILVSKYSRKVNRVNASFEVATAQEAKRLAEEMRAQFRRAGWIEAGAKGFPEQAFNPLGDDIADFNSERGGLAKVPTGRRVEVDADDTTVTLVCIDLPGFVKHMEEAFGPPPVSDARPKPPAPLPAEAVKMDCTRPLSESEKALANDENTMIESMGRYQEANDYFEQLMEWNGQQFIKAGKWTQKQKEDFEFNLLSHPDLKDNWSYFISAVTRVLGHVGAMADGATAKSDARVCQALNALFADVAEHGRRTLAHTAAIDRIFRAEATKLGVSLD